MEYDELNQLGARKQNGSCVSIAIEEGYVPDRRGGVDTTKMKEKMNERLEKSGVQGKTPMRMGHFGNRKGAKKEE